VKYKPDHVLIRARNGDVVAYDETGLILRLSDAVIADIRARLGTAPASAPGAADIDAWNLRAEGEWVRFDACLPPFAHTRAYRRRVGGSVLADAQGPLMAVLTVGGAAASLAYPGGPAFPHHVVAPGDDLGPSGAAGTERVRAVDTLQTTRESTQGSLLADALLARRLAARRALPLIAARAETDESGTVAELLDGPGMRNVEAVLDGLVRAAGTLGTGLKVLAVTVDYGAEDVTTPVAAFVQGIRAVVDRLVEACARRGLSRPLVILQCDGGPDGAARQWELAAFPAGQPTVVTGPAYALPRTRHGRLTREGAAMQAARDAAMLEARAAGEPWACPLPVLAEREGEDGVRVTFLAESALEIGGAHGFALRGRDVPAIRAVEVAPDDARAVVLRLAGASAGVDEVDYAVSEPGGVRDGWRGAFAEGVLYRWALPARLELH
jgi:hypothetical protein